MQSTAKVATAFRLNSDLVTKLKELAKKDNRSLNNYVENILSRIVYSDTNKETIDAIKEAQHPENLDDFDMLSLDNMIKGL